MTKVPTVSIIVPNRNYAAFIPDAIASIKAQTLTDWECIIIDDASTDNSVEVIKELIANDPRFKLVAIPQSVGISAARNVGLDMAKGEYVSFLDSDDCYVEYFLEMLLELLHKANVDVAGARSKAVNKDFHFKPSDVKWNTNSYVVLNTPLQVAKQPQEHKWIWIWRKIYKRSVLEGVRFRDEMKVNGDDVMFLLDLSYRVNSVAECEMDGVYHRVHNTSVSSVNNKFNLERVKMFPLMFKFIREELFDKYDQEFWAWYYPGLFSLLLQECIIKYNDSVTKQEKKDIKKILSSSCKFVIKKQIPFKHRLLCRYLTWIK